MGPVASFFKKKEQAVAPVKKQEEEGEEGEEGSGKKEARAGGARPEARGRRSIWKTRVGPLGLVLGLGPEEEEGNAEASLEMVLRPQEEQ